VKCGRTGVVAIRKLDELGKEIRGLRSLVLFRGDTLVERRPVSLRCMGKLFSLEKESEQSLGKARKSLFTGAEEVVRH
jgi:hypothetical protein